MADHVQDIVVSENYGRAKRASLLYGAALIVLALATPRNGGVSVLGADVPLDAAKILTWLAALYYTINFVLEWRVARLTNSKAMATEVGGGVITRLEALAERFQLYHDRIEETGAAYVTALEGLSVNVRKILEKRLHSEIAADWAIDEANGFREPAVERNTLSEAEREDIVRFNTTIQTDKAIVERAGQEHLDTCKTIATALTQLVSDFRTVSGRFNSEQRIMFYGLDLGAVGVIFVAGTSIALLAAWGIIHGCYMHR